jgi:molybdopterin molybdotransferase
MDGYAIVASSSKKGARLQVIGEQPAGVDRQHRISPGEAVRIFTGAPIPAGADAVVMQEDATREGDEIVVNVDVHPVNSSAARLRFSGRPENSRIR